ncbi:peptidoglycan D,D-transpeptidase FtsI family protein [Dongia deserti]|uniref:peptidoglycan D,D-transpeptidase FtsI family protein n=1 Tax=Dongia deserti TaxID=2268030 RepID=UPI0025474E7A|nr:penicillin-binding protein 2 [Dongia deserti]
MTRRPAPDLVAQRPQPVINPMTLEMEPDGPRKRALEVSHSRVLLGASLFAVVFLVIAARLVAITVLPDGADSAAVAPVKTKTADRADIVDRNGVVLATSLTTASLYANPRQVQNPDEAAQLLNSVLPDLNIASTAAKLDTDRGFIWLKRDLTPRQQLAVNRLGLPGIYFQAESKRVYPQGNLTAHLVGFTDVDSRGLAGVERSFDDLLQSGDRPLQLSIDVRVQHILHEELNRAIVDFNGIGGAGIIIDLKSGEVLAMISLPDFDPARPGEAIEDARFDRATLGLYEMGSVFKIFNTAIALDSGTVTLADGFDATKPIRIGGHSINDYKGKHRFLTIPEIFTYSSNIGSAKMADLFGAEVQQAYLKRFGLMDKSPIELSEVGEPFYPSPKNWKRINTMTVSYGHGISINAMQLITAVGAVVNDGILREPTLLKRNLGELPEGTRVVSRQTSEQLRQLMRLVVQIGTGKKANAPGYLVGGKTGTADKQKGRGYAANTRLASFVAAFPMNDPRFAILAMVDEPKPNASSHGYATAGWVTAPVVGAVVQRIAPLYGLKPLPDDALEAQNPLVGMVADYDSPSAKKAQSALKQAVAPAPIPFGAAAAPTPLNVSAQPISIPEAPLEAE